LSLDRSALPGRWVHAHEQDSGEEMVFVPSDHELPPSRGRRGLELEQGGEVRESGPGPTDRPEAQEAIWELTDDDQLIIRAGIGGPESWRARVIAAEGDRLVLDKASIR
jgi:hypothetical protein